ncbi:Nucleotidyltransferase [Ceraceosorus guamensis]|uniref:polynucleotide adenylyltransferase n=1 Tax=Ceraceosorus guamensis TaxID=1522189 RepID=A0A316W928_9BASI|nr:Nucleotidyltransferase [Ceraceosorus guamensis]PWN44543.1 Nucleotidyltransferase [Ceraceosorus guamensis]
MATSATAGNQSNSFISGQDYIGFDFDDDDGEEQTPHGAVDERGVGRRKDVNGRHTSTAGPSNGPGTLAGAQRNGASRDRVRGDRRRSPPALGPGRIQPQSRRRTFEEMAMDDGLTKRERMRSMARATPWALDVDWDSCWHPTEMLHRELEAFERWISPTSWEHDCRAMVIQLIRNAICSQWRDAEVLSFGSHDTRLYMPEGDIDLVVISRSMENEHRTRTLNKIAALLRRANLVVDLAVISKAKVPIVKFTCVHAKYKVDISINQSNGLAAAKWVSAWLRKQPSLRPLILAVKLLLNQRGMSEVFNGGLGSYSVICLVISHLQMHPKVQRGELDPAKNLGVLLLEFLELYGKTFNYHTVGISVRGQGHYFEKKRHAFVSTGKPYMLAIEDPLDASNDISRGTFQIQAVRLAMKGAFDILSGALCQRANVMSDPNAQDGAQHAPFDEDDEARAALMQNAAVGAPVSHSHSLLGNIFGISHETTRAREKVSGDEEAHRNRKCD